MLPSVEMIAARVRELRDILDVQIEDIAREIDVTTEQYIAYESGNDDIPIGKLYLIANALGVDPTLLLIGDNPRMVDYTLIRKGKGVSVERYEGYRFTSLAYNYIDRQMEPMIVDIDPNDKPAKLVTHEGQEFNMVLEGTVAITLQDKEYVLYPGDSIYFNPQIPHGQRAVGDAPARFLTVINE
jgi:transcriptional regulator with XRE-family HTH domain